uniref:Family with sequence similarity 120 member B n=1 Tax=Latimeria chalumnae TaxID=7897 RepID=H3A804_LATCH
MGVKGLQSFVENACPGACVEVNLKEMAECYQRTHPERPPTVVVDAMGCLRHWYNSDAWVHGGQWREYLQVLKSFVENFTAAGIKLVFFFDGTVEQKKIDEWVKRRLRNNKEIAKIFQYIKAHGQQPGRSMFFIPSGLATFTRFALKSLGLETMCSVQEADYEIARYGLLNNCMGILGQDSDYLIYDTSPYFSISKLCLNPLVSVMFSRENLCHTLGLNMADLPLLACLLGNDVVPEGLLERFRRNRVALFRQKGHSSNPKTDLVFAVADFVSGISCSHNGVEELENVLQLGSDRTLLEEGLESYILPEQQSPWLPHKKRRPPETKEHETSIYPDQEILQGNSISLTPKPLFSKNTTRITENVTGFRIQTIPKSGLIFCIFFPCPVSFNCYKPSEAGRQEAILVNYKIALFILHSEIKKREFIFLMLKNVLDFLNQPYSKETLYHLFEERKRNQIVSCLRLEQLVAKEQHVRAESFMVYNVLNAREVQCSNTLEDELDPELPGQAIVYRPARQRIYAVLLGARQGPSELCPVVKEWFVYPGNALKQPDLVPAESLNLPGGTPSLQRLWLAEGPEVKKLRYHTFLACFNVQELLEELSCLDALIAGVCCLLIYLTLEIKSLCLEDLEAYVAQILCICGKSAAQLSHIQLPWVNPRAVHLGSLFVRGLTTLISANSTCGFPFKMADLMPWEVFDGKLFHLKYQQSHQGISVEERLENNESMVKQFHKLMALIVRSCSQKNRIIRTRPHRSEGEGYEQRNPSVRGQGPPFQSGQRFPSFPSHHNQGSGIQWRGSRTGAVGNDMQLPDRRYRSGYRGRSRQVQLAPRWSGYQEPYAGRR